LLRKILGIVAGVVVATLIVTAFEWVTTTLYPIPEVDSDDYATLASVMTNMPMIAKLLVVAGWLAGAAGGAWLALRISDWRWAAWIVAAIMLAGSIANIVALPHPLWMQACALLFPVLGGWIGIKLHRKPYPGEALLG
jgi:MFS family permease